MTPEAINSGLAAFLDTGTIGRMRNSWTMLAGTAAVAATFGLPCGTVHARSLKIIGTAGYLAEWELKADVAQRSGAVSGEFSGPISLKHVGLCTVNGPVVKEGDVKLTISGWGPFARLTATMTFPTSQCTYSGSFADRSKGTMDCSDAKGIPLSLSIQ